MIRNKKIGIKDIRGNITIMVLVIGLVIIVAITALTKFMFEDVRFTKLDENKLKALNVAEAGVSNMYSSIEKFHNDEIPLPSSPYDGDVVDSDGDTQGSFTVAYEEIYNDQGKLTNYIITSEGTDEGSGQTRTVKVNLAVSFSTEVDIFSYIYSEGGLEFFDLINVSFINGPLYVGGDLVIRDLIALGDVVSGDRILVGENLDMQGSTRLRSEMINVGGDIEMNGSILGSPFIESSSIETLTMIVMNDIRLANSSRIGSSSKPVDLSYHGTNPLETRVYYNPPLGDDLFDPPKLNVEVYVNGFIDQIQEPQTDVLVISEEDMTEIEGKDVFVIDPELIPDELPPNDVFFKENGSNSIRFYENSGNYYLEVEGNIQVNGDIRIGKSIDDADKDIYYSEIGKLVATGDIDASCGLVPVSVGDFPNESLLILMSAGNLNIEVEDYNNYIGDYEDPDLYILGIAGGTALLNAHNAVQGSLICGQIDARDADGFIGRLLGSFATIGYNDDLENNMPEDLPKIVYGGATFSKEWQEVVE